MMDLEKLLPNVPTHKVVVIHIAPIHKIPAFPKINTKKEIQRHISNEDVKNTQRVFDESSRRQVGT